MKDVFRVNETIADPRQCGRVARLGSGLCGIGLVQCLWAVLVLLVCARETACFAQTSVPGTERPGAANGKLHVLVLAEAGGHHIAFTRAAKPWLERWGRDDGFDLTYLTNTVPITTEFLTGYQVFLQLDYPPYGWPTAAVDAFRNYIEQGKGGWVGLHHATLLGKFDGYPMWEWFSDFMGSIEFKNYIPDFVAGTVRVEARDHPVMAGVPASFTIPREEWYIYNRSPRSNIRVLASVDESTYPPSTNIKMGDHPVVWTNERMKARNVYLFMGHGPDLFESAAFSTMFHNSILWAAGKPVVPNP